MNKVKFTVLAIVAAFATTAAASDIEFHGYTRAGIGLAATGGAAVCFHLNGADTDFRLGNECDYVIEPNFEITMAKLDDKSSWGFHFMPKVYKRWQPMGGRDLDPLAMWVGQVYFFGNNIPWLANGSIWAGRKYWDRLQLGINDQFLENEDSESFGVENMDLGVAKLSIGFGLGKDGCGAGSNVCPQNNTAARATPIDLNGDGDTLDDGETSFNVSDGGRIDASNFLQRRYRIAARLTGIQTLNKDSSLQIWAAYYGQLRNSELPVAAEVDSGWRFALYHNFGFGSAGNLFVGGKIDKNSSISGYDGNGDGRTAWRIFAQYGVAVPSIRTSIDILAEYRDSKPEGGGDHGKWMAVGARADAQLSGPFRFLLEAGYDRAQTGSADATTLLKITPVLAISAGNDPWSRPTFRLYYTYASWSDPGVLDGWSSQGANDSGVAAVPTSFNPGVFGTDKSGSTFGVQAEGWW